MNRVFKIYYAVCVVGTFCLLNTSGTRVSLSESNSTKKEDIFFDEIREFHHSVRQNSGSTCQSSSDCASPRQCYNTDFGLCTSSSGNCFCFDLDNFSCSTSSDCLENDVCVEGFLDNPLCLGCEVAASDSIEATPVDNGNCGSSGGEGNGGEGGGDDGTGGGGVGGGGGNAGGEESGGDNNNVCIAVDALKRFSSDELVFKHRKQAAVLCDQHENCATPGHMVVYQGNGMMMSAYCTQNSVTCNRRVKLVNSPRMKPGLRIPSRHPELQFTALAASKQTFVKHVFLKVVLRMEF